MTGLRTAPDPARRWLRWRSLVAVILAVAVTACGGGSDDDDAADATTTAPPEETTTTTEPSDTTTTAAGDETSLPPGQSPGPYDLNDDGEPDPMCGEQDFGAGLVLQRFCDAEGYAGEVPPGVTLTDTSLFRFPTSGGQISMEGISGDLILGADPGNNMLYVIVFRSDALFATGGADINNTDSLDGVVRLVNETFPGARLQLRGHTDSTGDPGANQSLSEARAASVQSYLTDHGVQAAEVTTIGFGETQPLALEDTDEGLEFNRRVELVIRPAA